MPISLVLNICTNQELTEELKESKGSFHGIECDLTSEPQILAMFEKIKAEHGGVDVLVNNAGLAHTAHLLTGQTNDWKNMLDVSSVVRNG